ncbi:protein kinase domain-containing protein [Balneola sp. MJW-20]|uniref:protein kinase domain-containing protein n=1 Tax=Gracilimonas aurantiaca TaxID=3234185 RepID=UPI003465C2C4
MPESILHYNIIEKLGEGGMGVVYLAEDTKLNRKVALKFLPDRVSRSDEVRERFMQEARSAAVLNHPNIAQVYAIEEENEDLFIAMEYVEGRDLKDALKEESYSIEQKYSIAEQVALGLKEAHNNGIIHRDIKSANIRIKQDGTVKVMDFGLARLEGSEHITKEGTTIGTTAYMAPEQLLGKEANARSDIWAFGVLLFEIFAGEMPFQGVYEQAIMYAIAEEDPKDILELAPDTPTNVMTVIDKCLQKLVENRYESMQEILNDLEDESLRPSKRKKKGTLIERTPALLAGIILTLVALSVIIIMQDNGTLFGSGELDRKYLAVLPVENIGGDVSMQAICEGLAETLSFKLSEVERYEDSYWVAPAGEMRNENIKTVSEASEKFGVNLAILSSMQSLGDSTRLTIELVDADNTRRIDVKRVMVESGNFLKLEREGVRAMLAMLNIEVNQGINASLTEDVPEDPEAYEYYLKGVAALQKGELADNLEIALENFRKAVEIDEEFALGYAGIGEVQYEQFQTTREQSYLREAESSVQTSLELNDKLIQIQILLGRIKSASGKLEEAVGHYYEAINIDPKYSEAYSGMAGVFSEMGNPEQAEQTYLQAIRLKPAYWKSHKELATFYYVNGQTDKAIEQFEKVTQLTPRNSTAYSNLGGVLIASGQKEKGRTVLERALAIDNNVFAAGNLAYMYYYDGMFEESAMMYELAAEENSNWYAFWGNLGSAYALSGQENKAREAYEKAVVLALGELEVNENNATVMADLASYYSDLGKRSQALEYIDRATKLNDQNSEIRYRAVSTYFNLGETDEALKWLDPGTMDRVELEPELQGLVNDPAYAKWKAGIEDN